MFKIIFSDIDGLIMTPGSNAKTRQAHDAAIQECDLPVSAHA